MERKLSSSILAHILICIERTSGKNRAWLFIACLACGCVFPHDHKGKNQNPEFVAPDFGNGMISGDL